MKKTILASVLIMAGLLAGTSVALAHSEHDRSYTGIKWEFTEQTNVNINAQLKKYSQVKSFGLSRLENKIMDQYGVKAGRTFDAKIDNKLFRFQRTASGVKIVKQMKAERAFNVLSLPVNKVFQAVRTSLTFKSHASHDHSHFPYEWIFSEKIQKRIENKIKSGNLNGLVGLSKFDRDELGRYGIRIGMTFMSSVLHSRLMGKLTTGGIRIMKVVEPAKVAALPNGFVSSVSSNN
jgi:hypothetical protein